MGSDPLLSLRAAVDAAGERDRAAFAREARNAVAQAILAAALTPDSPCRRAEREPPEAKISELLGPDLGGELAELYRGGADWTSRAIDLLEPLNHVAHAE
ncbi:MAG TPA: hypothetical protein VIL77_14290 [Gaiellaceae bacterium]